MITSRSNLSEPAGCSLLIDVKAVTKRGWGPCFTVRWSAPHSSFSLLAVTSETSKHQSQPLLANGVIWSLASSQKTVGIWQNITMSSESTHAAQMDGGPDVQELHGDLARKFRTVSTKVDSIWRRFTPDQRGQAMKESTGDGVVLKHSNDRTLGDLCDYIPEYNLRDMINAIMIPRAIGELVLLRQQLLLQFLNHIIEEILDLGSETRNKKAPEKTINGALVSAASNLRIEPKPLRSSLSEVLAQAVEIKATLEDNLQLLRIEPTVLNQTVKALYWSRADLVPDDRGRILPAITDRHLSAALFDALTTAVRTTATWDYIIRLLQLVDDSDKVKKGLVMQELSNTCHLEYRRAQESLKRNIAPQAHVASKNFKRITDKTSGQSRIVMKGQPADYTVSNPQLHYILRLCHSDTSPTAAVQWMQKIDDHNARHVDDRMKLSEVEMNSLGDLAIIVSFMHMASTAISMVPVSRKSGLLFTARSAELDTELNSLKTKADFGDYLVPMDNLLEPHMASNALAALNDFVIEGTGARLGSLYEDIVQDSLNDLEDMYAEAKARLEKAGKSTTYVPIPKESSPDGDARLEHRRVKEKTRPAQSSVYTLLRALRKHHRPSSRSPFSSSR